MAEEQIRTRCLSTPGRGGPLLGVRAFAASVLKCSQRDIG